MHGLIHVVLKDLVLNNYGVGSWRAILAEIGLDDDAPILDVTRQYDDATTIAGVTAAAKVLEVSWDTALEVYGTWFVGYVYEGGYGRMLKSMGDTLQDFLSNVNHTHQYLERQFRESNFPSFCVQSEGADVFLLSYSSSRGLALKGLLTGLLSEAAKRLFSQSVVVEELDETLTGFLLTMRITIASLPKPESPAPLVYVDPERCINAAHWHACLASLGRCDFPLFQQEVEPVTCSWRIPRERQPTSTEKSTPADCAFDLDASTRMLDAMAKDMANHPAPADVLMRAARAKHVCAEWKDAASLDRARSFWETYSGDARYYGLSRNVKRATRFVSHSWRPPSSWTAVMGTHANYGEVKATELTLVAKDLAAGKVQRSVSKKRYDEATASALETWEDVTFWVDKCCIPQGHALMKECFARLEDFIARCDGMVVLLSWEYFERLWCIYEWAAFLIHHEARDVQLCVDAFLKPATLPLYLVSVANFSVSSAQCDVESDRDHLQAKVAEYFVSERAFEVFARGTAIAILAQTAVRRAGRGRREYEEEYLPWVELAEELDLPDLARALLTADPIRWRREARRASADANDSIGKEAEAFFVLYDRLIEKWFDRQVAPAIAWLKNVCVRRQYLSAADVSAIQLAVLPPTSRSVQEAPAAAGPPIAAWPGPTKSGTGSTARALPTPQKRRWLDKTISRLGL